MFIILMLNSPGKIAIATNPPRASRDKQAQIYEKYWFLAETQQENSLKQQKNGIKQYNNTLTTVVL